MEYSTTVCTHARAINDVHQDDNGTIPLLEAELAPVRGIATALFESDEPILTTHSRCRDATAAATAVASAVVNAVATVTGTAPINYDNMGPEIPGWIPFAENDHLPRTTAPVPASPKPPPPPPAVVVATARVVGDFYYDEFGIATVTVNKPSADVVLGIRLMDAFTGVGVSLEGLQPNSILASTSLRIGMNILSMNDIDCTNGMSAENVMDFISSIVGDLTIVAVDNTAAATAAGGAAPPTDTAAASYDLKPAAIVVVTERIIPTPPKPPPQPPKPITVTIYKSSKRSSAGISIADEFWNEGDTTKSPVISKLDPKGLCAAHNNCPLRPGMRILSVNGLKCYTKDDTVTKIKRAPGMVQIQAQAPTPSFGDNEDGIGSATAATANPSIV